MAHRPDMGLFLFRIRKFTEEQSFVGDTGLSLTLHVLKTEEEQTLKKNILRVVLAMTVCLFAASGAGRATANQRGSTQGDPLPICPPLCEPGR